MSTTGSQLSFEWPIAPSYLEEDFLVHASNAHAVRALENVRDWKASALCLEGPKGSGKTHLCAIWAQKTGALIMACSALTREGIPKAFQRGGLVVEDAPGAQLDEVALFHLINFSKEHGYPLIVTTDLDPWHWPLTLKDLASRMRAMPKVTLGLPDDDLLRAVVVKLFSDRQLTVPAPVLDYLLARMHRSFEEARALVRAIDREALTRKAAVTKPLVARVLFGRGQQDEREEQEG